MIPLKTVEELVYKFCYVDSEEVEKFVFGKKEIPIEGLVLKHIREGCFL